MTNDTETEEMTSISETSTSENQEASDEIDSRDTTSNNLTFEIVAGAPGEYGQELVLNEGTEFEDKTIGYFVPTGTYKITNIGNYQTQVNVYKNEKTKTSEGWEEWADGKSELLAVNASVEMKVEDGYFINVDEPTKISLEKID